MMTHAPTAFQLFLVLLFGALLVLSLVVLVTGRVQRTAGILRTLALLVATLAALWPNATSKVARLLGIGRGTDLILYGAVIAMMIGFWMVYVRLTELRREITLLVRREALREAGPLIAQALEAPAAPPANAPDARSRP